MKHLLKNVLLVGHSAGSWQENRKRDMIRSFRRLVCLWAVVMGACLMAGCEGGSSSTFQPATQTTTPTPVTTNPTDTTRRQGISGDVVDGPSVASVVLRSNALVQVFRSDGPTVDRGELVASTRTDVNGAFFVALEPGTYVVVCDLPEGKTLRLFRPNPADVRVLPNEIVSDLRLGYAAEVN